MVKPKAVSAAVLAAMLAAPPALAQGSSSSSSSASQSTSQSRNGETKNSSSQGKTSHTHNDQDDARAALRQGKVMPLTAILEIAFRREKGTVLELELETVNGVLVYEIELLSDAGRKVQMWINARSGEILKVRYP